MIIFFFVPTPPHQHRLDRRISKIISKKRKAKSEGKGSVGLEAKFSSRLIFSDSFSFTNWRNKLQTTTFFHIPTICNTILYYFLQHHTFPYTTMSRNTRNNGDSSSHYEWAIPRDSEYYELVEDFEHLLEENRRIHAIRRQQLRDSSPFEGEIEEYYERLLEENRRLHAIRQQQLRQRFYMHFLLVCRLATPSMIHWSNRVYFSSHIIGALSFFA